MPDSILDLMSLSVVGHPLALNATCAERRAYREYVLQLPGPIDRWLTANSRCPRIWFLRDYLMLANVQEEYVTCFVERECVMGHGVGTTIHSLYITACVSPSYLTVLFPRKSPRVFLDRFVGSNRAIHAPDWSRWTETSREFQQPKAAFADLFIRMAAWDANKAIPGLSYEMAQWSRSIKLPSEIAGKRFEPVTPKNRFRDPGPSGNVKKRRIHTPSSPSAAANLNVPTA